MTVLAESVLQMILLPANAMPAAACFYHKEQNNMIAETTMQSRFYQNAVQKNAGRGDVGLVDAVH